MVNKRRYNFILLPLVVLMVSYELLFVVNELLERFLNVAIVQYAIIPLSGLPMLITYKIGGSPWMAKWMIIHFFQFIEFFAACLIFRKLKRWQKPALIVLIACVNLISFFYVMR
jgi:hypothetical protein